MCPELEEGARQADPGIQVAVDIRRDARGPFTRCAGQVTAVDTEGGLFGATDSLWGSPGTGLSQRVASTSNLWPLTISDCR